MTVLPRSSAVQSSVVAFRGPGNSQNKNLRAFIRIWRNKISDFLGSMRNADIVNSLPCVEIAAVHSAIFLFQSSSPIHGFKPERPQIDTRHHVETRIKKIFRILRIQKFRNINRIGQVTDIHHRNIIYTLRGRSLFLWKNGDIPPLS